MSLILDALKRAQDNRQSTENTSPTVDLLQSPPPPTPAKSLRGILWLIIFLLLAILITLWFLLKKSHDPALLSPATSVSSVAQIASSVIRMEAQVSSSLASQPVAESALISDLYHQTHSSVPGIKDVQIAQLYVESVQASSSMVSEEINQSISVTNPLPDVNNHLPERMQVTTEIRSITNLIDVTTFEELSLKQKQLFPSINYSQHNYLGNSASSVVINGELMRVRSRIADRIEIVDILEDGIVLDVNGRRVSFKALNSWINM